MAETSFDKIMEGIFRHEGGYVNHPKDPGGETNLGITHRTLQSARKTMPSLPASVRNLTKADAKRIYRANYWNPIRGVNLMPGVDYVTMDAAVNSGVKRGVQWTQRAVDVKADGVMGPVTLSAAYKAPLAQTITRAADIRRGFLRGLRTFTTFGRGWMRRVAEVEAAALKMTSIPLSVLQKQATQRVDAATNRTTQSGGAAAGAGGTSFIGGVPDWAAFGALGVLVLFTVFVVAPRVKIERERRAIIEEEFAK